MAISGLWNLPALGGMDWATGPGGLVVLFLALLLDAVIGDPRWLPHPVRALGGLIGWLDARLNREKRGEVDRMMRGLVTVLLVAGLAAVAGWVIGRIAAAVPFGWCIELAAITLMIAQRSMVDHAVRVVRGLRHGGLKGGREAVRRIVGRDVSTLDEPGVSRAAIESIAESFTDGVVAPVFWYLVLGLPGLFAFKAISTLDSMIGHRSDRHASFGMVAARLDDAVNWLPARIAGPVMALAALFTPGARPGAAFHILFRDATKHISPNAGWTEAAMAGALGLKLLGPRQYPGEANTHGAWLGKGRAAATASDIVRALVLFAVACFLVAGFVAIIAAAAQLGHVG